MACVLGSGQVSSIHSAVLVVFLLLVLAGSLWWFWPVDSNQTLSLDAPWLFLMSFAVLWWVFALLIVCSYPKQVQLWQTFFFKVFAGCMVLLPFYYVFYLLRFSEIYPQGVHGAWVLLYVIALVCFAIWGLIFPVVCLVNASSCLMSVREDLGRFSRWCALCSRFRITFTYSVGFELRDALLWLLCSDCCVCLSPG